ncbi:MAG: DNA-deoxyinosine glycosylase [Clostridiales bacterium]|nr:DNA-deoxyinosine glycosylase [Clostridiales bacterium]
MNKECLKPIIDKESKILVLGSMPGEESLRLQQYYAFNRNQFWDIIFSTFNRSQEVLYESKCEFLLSKKIALWDVINTCNREGSLDSDIKNEIINDFHVFFNKHNNIKFIIFNGGKAEKTFKKYIGKSMFPNIKFFKLPSTSPMRGKYVKSLYEKKKEWSSMLIKLLDY